MAHAATETTPAPPSSKQCQIRHWLMRAIVRGVTISISHGVTFSYDTIPYTTMYVSRLQLVWDLFSALVRLNEHLSIPPLFDDGKLDGDSSNLAPQA